MTPQQLFSMNGKNALITGGGTGIGKAIAHAFSDAGARIAIVGRREAMLTEALEEREGTAIVADLMADDAPQSIYTACEAADIMPDVIVNAAGLNPRKHADDVTAEVWQQTIHLNLSVPFFLSQIFVPHMKQKQWGRIINIALSAHVPFTKVPGGISGLLQRSGIQPLCQAALDIYFSMGEIGGDFLALWILPG